MAHKEDGKHKIVADNRRARYDYELGEVYEAGLVLTGPEVKSLRAGKATVQESYASVDRDGLLRRIDAAGENDVGRLGVDRFERRNR